MVHVDPWAEPTMLQYLTKMAHPVLRRVSQLDIAVVMDLMENGARIPPAANPETASWWTSAAMITSISS